MLGWIATLGSAALGLLRGSRVAGALGWFTKGRAIGLAVAGVAALAAWWWFDEQLDKRDTAVARAEAAVLALEVEKQNLASCAQSNAQLVVVRDRLANQAAANLAQAEAQAEAARVAAAAARSTKKRIDQLLAERLVSFEEVLANDERCKAWAADAVANYCLPAADDIYGRLRELNTRPDPRSN